MVSLFVVVFIYTETVLPIIYLDLMMCSRSLQETEVGDTGL